MEPSCGICGVHVHDEEMHRKWHEKLRELLQEMANAVYGHGNIEVNEEIEKL